MEFVEGDIILSDPAQEMELLKEVEGFFHGLRPIERITVSEWSDTYRFLSGIASAEAGRYRTERTPFLRKIMDCLSAFSPYRKIVTMKGAQIGFSEAACNFIGYSMHIAPAPTLFVQPTDMMIARLSKTRIDPLISACPELASRVAEPKSRDGKNTVNMKAFPGGVLILTGANSGSGLRSMPARNLILDEVDAYPQDVDDEGSPIDLAIARTRTFPNRKILIGSTPTVSGLSAIEREFLETDQNYYHVPCPHCGEKQKLVFENLKWDEGKPETAAYACIHCGCLIEERYKIQMFADGEWIPEVPEKSNDDVIGFHISSLYSPYGWQSWSDIARQFLESKNNQTKLKVFINTVLGETWAERGDAPEYKNLYNRREEYRLNELNEDVCFLTAGIDVQKDRVEIEIVGWCKNKSSYSIDYRVIEGDTADVPVWLKLGELLEERWKRPNGMQIPIRMMAVDSGYNTSHVYAFCRRYSPDRVVPIKGLDNLGMVFSAPKTVDITRAGKRVGHVRLYGCGSSFLKSELYSWLRLEKDENGVAPPCYCHFPQYAESYFRGLTAEEQVKKVVKGYTVYEWQKKYERNEPLDCRVYARVAASIVGLDRMRPEHLEMIGGIATQLTINFAETANTNGSEIKIPDRPKRESIWTNRGSIWA